MRKIMTWMILTSIVTAQPAVFAEKYAQDTPQFTNVELNEKNELVGKLVDATGAPVAGTKIAVRGQKDLNKTAQVVSSEKDGRFVLAGLRSGRLVFDIGTESYACQAWTHGTAPPRSLKTISVVQESTVVRGQNCKPTLRDRIRCMSPKTKLCIGLLIATAIIVPIALDDDDAS